MNDIDFKNLQHQIEWFTFELRRLQGIHRLETGQDHFVTGFERMKFEQLREESRYTPDWCRNLTFYFHFTPAEPETFDNPGCPAEVDFTRIEVNGAPAGDDLEEILFEQLGDRVEGEIISKSAPRVDIFDCLRIREAV